MLSISQQGAHGHLSASPIPACPMNGALLTQLTAARPCSISFKMQDSCIPRKERSRQLRNNAAVCRCQASTFASTAHKPLSPVLPLRAIRRSERTGKAARWEVANMLAELKEQHFEEGNGESRAQVIDRIEKLQKELAELEEEREQALDKAEVCRRRSKRLARHAAELLCSIKVALAEPGDEADIRQRVKDKQSAVASLEKVQARAETNSLLAARLTSVIGKKEKELLEALTLAPNGYQLRGPPSSGRDAALVFRSFDSGEVEEIDLSAQESASKGQPSARDSQGSSVKGGAGKQIWESQYGDLRPVISALDEGEEPYNVPIEGFDHI